MFASHAVEESIDIDVVHSEALFRLIHGVLIHSASIVLPLRHCF